MDGTWRTWSSQRCPFSWQRVRTRWNLRCFPTQIIPQFCDSMISVRDIQVQHLACTEKLLICNNLSSQIFPSGQRVTEMKMRHKWAQVFWQNAFYWKNADFSEWNIPQEHVNSERSRLTMNLPVFLPAYPPSAYQETFCLSQNTSRYQCRRSAIRFQVSRRWDPPGSQTGNAFTSAELPWMYFSI